MRLEPLAQIALLLAVLLACKGGSKSNTDTSAPTVGQAAAPEEKALAVTAADLIADYKANEVRGDAKWKGKLVDVVGKRGKDLAAPAGAPASQPAAPQPVAAPVQHRPPPPQRKHP